MNLEFEFDITRNVGFLFNDDIIHVIRTAIPVFKQIYNENEKLCKIFDALGERIFTDDVDLELFLRNDIAFSDYDINNIIKDFKNRNLLNTDSKQFILTKLEDLLNEYIWTSINNRTDLTATQKVEKIKLNSFNLAKQSILESTIVEGELEELKMDHTFGHIVYSHCSILNKCSPVGGLLDNTFIALAAAPGAGKSLFLMREAYALAKQGRNVLYTALGDLDLKDFKSRLYAIINNVPIDDFFLDTRKSEFVLDLQLKKLKEIYGGSIDIQIVPAAVMSIQDYEMRLDTKGYRKKCNTFILDFDNNIYSTLDMHEKGREIYNYFARLSDEGNNICYVAGQLTKSSLNEVIIGMEGLGESRAKAEVADIVMTFSKNRNAVNTTGVIALPKVRRGKEGASIPYFLDISGLMYEIDNDSYNTLIKSSTTPVTYCERGGKYHVVRKYDWKGHTNWCKCVEGWDIDRCENLYYKELEKMTENITFVMTAPEYYEKLNEEGVKEKKERPLNSTHYISVSQYLMDKFEGIYNLFDDSYDILQRRPNKEQDLFHAFENRVIEELEDDTQDILNYISKGYYAELGIA